MCMRSMGNMNPYENDVDIYENSMPQQAGTVIIIILMM